MKMNAETGDGKGAGAGGAPKKRGPSPLSSSTGSSSSLLADPKKQIKPKKKEKKKAVEAPDHQNIACEGYLHRQSTQSRKQFKKQYFVLFEGTDKLFYFTSHEDLFVKNPQGAIDLSATTVASHTGKIRNPPGWEIRLKDGSNEYILIATLEDDKSMWLAALDRRLRYLNTSNDDRSLLLRSLNEKLASLQREAEEINLRRNSTSDPAEIKKVQTLFEEISEKILKTRESIARIKE